MKVQVKDGWLTRDGDQPQLILLLEQEGEQTFIAQDIDEDSYQGWLDEGLEEK